MADDDRKTQIVKAVDHLIQPGETWVMKKGEENGIEVLRDGTSSLESTHPELYGRLLKVSEQLSNAGGGMCIWGPLLVLVFCLGLHLNWFDGVLGGAADKLRSVWFYILAAIVSFFAFGSLARTWERLKYRQYRDAVLRASEDEQITPHRLIANIEGDEALENLADQLKADSDIV